MWVFGYGSLMWDGWEQQWDCIRRVVAELRGFVRVFNKLSVKNWGTREHPGPTLNLVPGAGSCQGVAFELPDTRRLDIIHYLAAREGKNFSLRDLPIRLEDGTTIKTIVPLYQGRNLIKVANATEIAVMALRARGTSGSCAHYIENIANRLNELGINDPAVIETAAALKLAPKDLPPHT
jgi:glutathione-specific gamma-glutamylcyclotransferase